ncbi:MAG: hypothetical protein IT369_17985 [Candidatus Latescibacteria bacterium]|nr:hypothetical protein [Candidatus Latescibacterota bacterium]
MAALAALWLASAAAADPDFFQYWGDGKAEISSYRVIQPRYGENRPGYGVMIFVTEDLHRDTFVKVESSGVPQNDRVYTLKLNNVLKFNTGIYDYSVMSSVFSAVNGPDHAFELCKISLTAQEWCGQVFEEVLLRGGHLEGYLNSYFEKEGRQQYQLAAPTDFESEDHLLIRIRELKGPWLAPGEERQLVLLPSLWSFRVKHQERSTVPARLVKGEVAHYTGGGQTLAACSWTLEAGGITKTFWVETEYPHRILGWEDSQGGRGELLVTVREPYWQLNHNADAGWRQRLQIP